MGGKSKVEEKVREGIYGPPEIKKGEKLRYLGQFRERVLRYLTYQQVMEAGIYPEIVAAIKDPRASQLIIKRSVDLERAQEYIRLALENKLAFKRVDSPDFKGDVALVVVSSEAVEVMERKVLPRRERLKARGISDKIIENVGAKLCDRCWEELVRKAPEELINYRKMTWLDKVLGTKCLC